MKPKITEGKLKNRMQIMENKMSKEENETKKDISLLHYISKYNCSED